MEVHGFSQGKWCTTAFFFNVFFHIYLSLPDGTGSPDSRGPTSSVSMPEDAAEAAGSPQATILVQKIDEKMKQTDAWSVNPCCERSSTKRVLYYGIWHGVIQELARLSLTLIATRHGFLDSPFICSLNLAVLFHALWESEIWRGSVLTDGQNGWNPSLKLLDVALGANPIWIQGTVAPLSFWTKKSRKSDSSCPLLSTGPPFCRYVQGFQ